MWCVDILMAFEMVAMIMHDVEYCEFIHLYVFLGQESVIMIFSCHKIVHVVCTTQ